MTFKEGRLVLLGLKNSVKKRLAIMQEAGCPVSFQKIWRLILLPKKPRAVTKKYPFFQNGTG